MGLANPRNCFDTPEKSSGEIKPGKSFHIRKISQHWDYQT